MSLLAYSSTLKMDSKYSSETFDLLSKDYTVISKKMDLFAIALV
jgi:hypothetical protein